MESVGLAAPLVLAFILALSGVAKLRSPRAAADSFVSLRMPAWLSKSIAPKLLPWGEVVLAVVLLVLPGPWGIAASVVTLILMLVYLVVIVRALGFDEAVECGCFGELGLGDVDRRTAWRNAILVMFGVGAVMAAVLDDRSPVQRWWQADGADWGWLLVIAVVVALAVLIIVGPARPAQTIADSGTEMEELDYLRTPIPFVEVFDAGGEVIRLRELASTQAQMLVFLSGTCASCLRIAQNLPKWADELAPMVAVRAVFPARGGPDAVLVAGDVAINPLVPQALYDPSNHLTRLMEIATVPGAVLLGVDGLLAGGPVLGERQIVEMVEELLAVRASN